MTKVRLFLSFGFFILIHSSCFKSEEYPIEPIISEPNFIDMVDSAIVSFNFTDGDGDIGLNDSEQEPPYDSSSFYHYNLYLDYYEKDDVNGWQRGKDLAGQDISFAYRIERIKVKGKQKGIKGKMEVTLNTYRNPFSSQNDTIKFVIKLIDRALNESNSIETQEIIFQ